MGFDEFDLGVIQVILFVELPVDIGNGLRPINVRGGGEVLEGNHTPNVPVIILCYF